MYDSHPLLGKLDQGVVHCGKRNRPGGNNSCKMVLQMMAMAMMMAIMMAMVVIANCSTDDGNCDNDDYDGNSCNDEGNGDNSCKLFYR